MLSGQSEKTVEKGHAGQKRMKRFYLRCRALFEKPFRRGKEGNVMAAILCQ